MKIKQSLAVGALLLFPLGCATEPSSIFKVFDLQEDHSVSTGSRQRIITNSRVGSDSIPGQVNPDRIVCAEPSPDVATALANSFGFGVSVLGQGSGSLAGSSAEGVIQLAERTVTVQLLRDQLYRACEAFGNGAISGTTYSLVMSRINETMVTLLLGETAGGDFGRKLGSIGSKANSDARAALKGLQDSIGKTQEATAELAKANQAVQDQQKIFDAKKELAEGKPEDSDESKAAEKEKGKLDDLIRHRNAIEEQLSNSTSTMASAATSVKANVDGSISDKPDKETATILASMQSNFLERDNTKAFVSACLVEMGRSLFGVAQQGPTLADELIALQKIEEPNLREMGTRLWEEQKFAELRKRREEVKQTVLKTESTLFEDLRKHWVELQEIAVHSPSPKDQQRADKALATLISFDRRRKPTALTNYCAEHLAEFVHTKADNSSPLEPQINKNFSKDK